MRSSWLFLMVTYLVHNLGNLKVNLSAMKKPQRLILRNTLFLGIIALFSACRDNRTLTIVVENKSDTKITELYMAGNFNNWNPKDSKYEIKAMGGTKFGAEIRLPESFRDSVIEYKYTLGSWDVVEADSAGNTSPNRRLPYKGKPLTAIDFVFHWKEVKDKKQSTASSEVSIWKTDFEMPQLNSKRNIWVYLPKGYETSEKRYPVIYMHDAQNLFDEATAHNGEWGVDEILSKLNKEIIVVGIEHGDSLRLLEYSPYTHEQYIGGSGTEYLQFIIETLKPAIDENFRTLPTREHTAIGGSSMGGLISLCAAHQHATVFSKFLVFSPSLWFNKQIFEDLATLKEQTQDFKIYLSVGGKEESFMKEDTETLHKQLSVYDNVDTELQVNLLGEHNEKLWNEEFPKAIAWIFPEDRK